MGGCHDKDAFTEASIPDQTGRVFVVTGANSGIGFDASTVLAKKGATVVMCARDKARGEEALQKLRDSLPDDGSRQRVFLEDLDVSNLSNVRAFCERAVTRATPSFAGGVDVVILNAGVMNLPKRQESPDGFEMQWATNHLGHFALVGLLMPLLRTSTKTPTVVPVSSVLARNGGLLHHRAVSPDTVDFKLAADGAYQPEPVYSCTKQANLLFANELHARHGDWLRVVPCHPGVCATNLFRHGWQSAFKPLFQSPAAGALIELRAAVDATLPAGSYIGTGNKWKGAPIVEEQTVLTKDEATQAWLWRASEVATGVSY